MGSCISTTTQRSNGDSVSSSHQGSTSHKQRRTKKTYSNQIIDLQHLALVPNRIYSNGKSKSSCMFTQQGRKGINQDAMIVWEDFILEDVTFTGVFDGHGPYGHLVARRVRDVLPVVDAAACEWKIRYPTSRMDDCAVVCLYLDGQMDPEIESDENYFLSGATLLTNPPVAGVDSDEGQNSEPTLQRNITVRLSSSENNYIYKAPAFGIGGIKETGVAKDQRSTL